MARIPRAILALLFVTLGPALAGAQEGSDAWLDGEALMLGMFSPDAPDNALLQQFHPECRIALDGVMARQIKGGSPLSRCMTLRRAGNRTIGWACVDTWVSSERAMTPRRVSCARAASGAPWMVRYAVRCRNACQDGMVGFEIRFTYDGRRVTRVELQAR